MLKFLHDSILVSSLFIVLQIAQYKLTSSMRERMSIRSRRGQFLLRSLLVSTGLAFVTVVFLSASPKSLFPGAASTSVYGQIISDRLLLREYGGEEEIQIMSCVWLCLNIDLLAAQFFICLKLIVALSLHTSALWGCAEDVCIDRGVSCRNLADVVSILRDRDRDLEVQREDKGKEKGADSSRQEALHLLLQKKVLLLCDVASLTYRSLLPIPVWYRYFGGSGMLPSMYLFMKAADLFEKIGGLGEAVLLVSSNAFEFGRPATPAEAAALDCPICFDRPLLKPVSLQCGHCFCAHCIGEWVDRTGSCPICRSPVQSSFRFLRKIRAEHADSTVVC